MTYQAEYTLKKAYVDNFNQPILDEGVFQRASGLVHCLLLNESQIDGVNRYTLCIGDYTKEVGNIDLQVPSGIDKHYIGQKEDTQGNIFTVFELSDSQKSEYNLQYTDDKNIELTKKHRV